MFVIVLSALLISGIIGFSLVIFVMYYMKMRRNSRKIVPILESVFGSLGFAYRKLGAGGKWTGTFGGRKITVTDFASIPGGHSFSGSQASGSLLQITIDKASSRKLKIENGQAIGFEDGRDLTRMFSAEGARLLERLSGAAFSQPVLVSNSTVQAGFNPEFLDSSLLQQCLEDLIQLADRAENLK